MKHDRGIVDLKFDTHDGETYWAPLGPAGDRDSEVAASALRNAGCDIEDHGGQLVAFCCRDCVDELTG